MIVNLIELKKIVNLIELKKIVNLLLFIKPIMNNNSYINSHKKQQTTTLFNTILPPTSRIKLKIITTRKES